MESACSAEARHNRELTVSKRMLQIAVDLGKRLHTTSPRHRCSMHTEWATGLPTWLMHAQWIAPGAHLGRISTKGGSVTAYMQVLRPAACQKGKPHQAPTHPPTPCNPTHHTPAVPKPPNCSSCRPVPHQPSGQGRPCCQPRAAVSRCAHRHCRSAHRLHSGTAYSPGDNRMWLPGTCTAATCLPCSCLPTCCLPPACLPAATTWAALQCHLHNGTNKRHPPTGWHPVPLHGHKDHLPSSFRAMSLLEGRCWMPSTTSGLTAAARHRPTHPPPRAPAHATTTRWTTRNTPQITRASQRMSQWAAVVTKECMLTTTRHHHTCIPRPCHRQHSPQGCTEARSPT
jgi:hypothetical protein